MSPAGCYMWLYALFIHAAVWTMLTANVEQPQSPDSDAAADGPIAATPGAPTPNTAGIPVFVEEPKASYYIVKHEPVTITCKVTSVTQITFKCAGMEMNPKRYVATEYVDRYTGIKYLQTSIEVSQEEVEEYFGLDGYWCKCIASNSDPMTNQEQSVESKRGVVHVAYLRKRFVREPMSMRVEVHTTALLDCLPPQGLPVPKVFWTRNGKLIDSKKDTNFIISNEGNLIINMARLSDTGNYTCGAQNLANIRISEPALLSVFVNGGWSSWSRWTECSSLCGKGTQRRTRECTSPSPANGGAKCLGKGLERIPCTTVCQYHSKKDRRIDPSIKNGVDGMWSSWSLWSTCSPDCKRFRRRMCDNPAPKNGGRDCHGNDFHTSDCTGGMCRVNAAKDKKDKKKNYSKKTGENFTVAVGKAVAAETKVKENGFDNAALIIGSTVAVATSLFIIIVLTVVFVLRKKAHRHGLYNHSMHGTEVHPTHYGNGEMKLNKNEQELLSLHQPDVTKTVVTIRNHNALDTPNDDHMNSMDKIPIYSEILSSTSTLTKNNRTLHEVTDPISYRSKMPTVETSVPDKEPKNSLSTLGSRPQSACSHQTNRHSGVSTQIPSDLDVDNLVWANVSHTGGRLSLTESGVCVTIPEGAVKKGCTEEIFLAVSRNDKNRPKLTDTQTLLGPIIILGPQGLALKKPVILTFQHCASIKHGQWNVTVHSSDTPYDDPPHWQHLVTIGQETVITPVFCQLDLNHCHIMTDTLARYVLLGESVPNGKPTKILRLAAFATMMPASVDHNVRVYVVEDTQDALGNVMQEERKLGAQLLDKPKQLLFQHTRHNLCLTVEDLGPGWRCKVAASYQEIPFHHVWSGTQTNLHCSFALEHIDREKENLSCKIQVFQKHSVSNRQVLHILYNLRENISASPVHTNPTTQRSSLVTQSSGCGGRNNSIVTLDSKQIFRMPPHIKEALCDALDPPNARGNDWRMLAKRLGVDRYINYFATKSSPTEHILNLWEARHQEENATTDLMNTLRVMGRMDAAGIIEKDMGSWL